MSEISNIMRYINYKQSVLFFSVDINDNFGSDVSLEILLRSGGKCDCCKSLYNIIVSYLK